MNAIAVISFLISGMSLIGYGLCRAVLHLHDRVTELEAHPGERRVQR